MRVCVCARDHQKVSPTGSSPCRQSCSSLFHARSACYPVTLQHPSSGFALNHSLHKQTQNGKYCGRLTTFTVHVCNAFITKSSQFIFIFSHAPALSTLLTLSACCRLCLCRCLYRLKRDFLLRPIPFSLGKSTGSLGGVPCPLLVETASTEDTLLEDGALLVAACERGNNRGLSAQIRFDYLKLMQSTATRYNKSLHEAL